MEPEDGLRRRHQDSVLKRADGEGVDAVVDRGDVAGKQELKGDEKHGSGSQPIRYFSSEPIHFVTLESKRQKAEEPGDRHLEEVKPVEESNGIDPLAPLSAFITIHLSRRGLRPC